MKLLVLILDSWIGFFRLVFSGSLHLRRDRLWSYYRVRKENYAIFRETVSSRLWHKKSVVLVVGFRLRFIQSNQVLHWFFQRICLFTTPFWSGFVGFRVKLWMVDPITKNYLGIYRWEGKQNVEVYVTTLVKILTPLSTPDSVWYEIVENEDFEHFLSTHMQISGSLRAR